MTATSKLTINLVVGLLGLALMVCLGGAIWLTATHNKVPDQIWTVGTTALGALASILVSTRTTPDAPATTTVTTSNVPEAEAPIGK